MLILLISIFSGCVDYEKERQLQREFIDKSVQESYWSNKILSNDTTDLSEFIDYTQIMNNGSEFYSYKTKLLSKNGRIYIEISYGYEYQQSMWLLDNFELGIKSNSPQALKISMPNVIKRTYMDTYGDSVHRYYVNSGTDYVGYTQE